MAAERPLLGLTAPWELAETARGLAARRDAGLDLVVVSDHVSFRGGTGQDGLLRAAAAHALHPELTVLVGVYLLALRHPTLVARQLADLHAAAPGRLLLGVGVGGDDRREITACGVDPATRGTRTDEALTCIRQLQRGEPITFHGQHFQLDEVAVLPPVDPPTPILVGGRAARALERAATHGDGWFGVFCSAARYADAVRRVETLAAQHDRQERTWRHGMHVWCSVDDDAGAAKRRLAAQMEAFYATPFERFAGYCPAGPAEEVASFLVDYVHAGATTITLAVAGTDDEAVAGAAAIRRHLTAELGAS
ncbi:MAG: LLM class flavin-dependent oxidoreductase [Ilumatobacteraceae bacterium]